MSLGLAAAVYFGLALLYFLPALLPGRHIYGTDYLVGSYFVHEFFSERFAAGELPKWLPYIYGGGPMFANPGSAFYPVRILADLFLPTSKLFPAMYVVQFGLAGLGMYLLALELGTRRWVAFIGGLAFQFTGITMSWVLAGHEGRIIVATFAPITFFFFHRGIRTGRVAPFVGAAAAIAFSLLTFQIQNSYYLLVGALIWSVFCLWHFGLFRRPAALGRTLALGLGAVAVAFLLASVNFLPFLDYVEQSPRGGEGGRGYDYSVSWSMPTAEVLAVAVPEQAGHLETYRGSNPMKLHTEYVGATVIALFALGFAFSRRNRYWWFFLGLGVFFLTVALGGNTPLYRLYYELLPGTKRFRAPSISFFMVSLSLVAMATLALESLAARWAEARAARPALRRDEPGEVPDAAKWILAGTVAAAFLLGAAAASAPGVNGAPGPGPVAFRFAVFMAATAAILWFWLRGSLGARAFVALLAGVTVLDLWIVDRKFFETVPPPDETFAADDVANFLRSQPGRDRVWVLPFPPGATYRGQAGLGNYLMRFDVDLAGGEHGNQLQRYNEFVGTSGETYVDWRNFLENPVFMDAANVRYLVAGAEFQDPRLREVHRGSALVYENLGALPRAYLVPQVVHTEREDGALELMKQPGFDPRSTAVVNADAPPQLSAGPLQGDARVVSYEPDRVVVRTRQDRDALLVLADNYYADWKARVDGREVPILRTNHTFRGVVLGPGEHDVVFTFEPADLRTGAIVYFVGMALLALYALFLLARWLRTRKGEPSHA
ncbi:MAG TPA: YfhO family protein [Longimicrobiaceae bacterium]|nr:YfhO family protein [Longimicrobiaceae bacterium]